MSMEMIWEYIDPQLFIVVPMLWGVGMALKKSMLKNNYIPIALLICSCRVVLLYLTGVKPVLNAQQLRARVFAGITQGSVIWLFSWITYEKMLKDKEE